MSASTSGRDPEAEHLSAACAAIGLVLPAEDLPALAAALIRHRAAMVHLRAAIDVDITNDPADFDAAWT